MDSRAWWATVSGVAKSWTQVKQLSTNTHTIQSSNPTFRYLPMKTYVHHHPPNIYICRFSTDIALYDTSEDVSEDEMAGWHHPCNGHELGQILGDGEGIGGLACCSPWGHKESDTTGRLNNKWYMKTSTAVLLVMTKHEKAKNVPTGEWINKLQYNHTLEYYSAVKRYQLLYLYVESKIWHKWIYLWNKNRLTDLENRLVTVKGGEYRLGV